MVAPQSRGKLQYLPKMLQSNNLAPSLTFQVNVEVQ